MGHPGVIHRPGIGRPELPRSVLPDGFQQPVPGRPGTGVVELHEVLVDQCAEEPDDLIGEHALAGGDSLGGGQLEPPGEHAKTGEHVALGSVQQLP
jgi:hypothetical protein